MTPQAFPSLPLDAWPERDRTLWLMSLEPTGPLDDAGLAAGWSEVTRNNAEKSYGRFLEWLRQIDALQPLASPESRVTKTLIQRFVTEYGYGRSELTIAGTVRDIAYMFRAMNPPDGIAWLTRMAHRRVNRARPARPKLPRLVPIAVIFALARRLMEERLADVGKGQRSGAVRYRDGFMLALLAACPMRRRNLAALRLGRTLLIKESSTRMRFEASDTKTRRALDFPMPEVLEPYLDAYLHSVRPLLLNDQADEAWLWIGRRGKPMRPDDISTRVVRTTRKHFNRSLSPHLFRDCAATDIALHDPTHIGITKHVLGHATLAPSQRYYNQAASFTAVARHADVIDQLRTADDGWE